MITQVVMYELKPEADVKEFYKELMASGNQELSRAEKGNLGYDYYFPAEDLQSLILVEKWEDQASMDAHHQTAHFKAGGALKEKYVSNMAKASTVS